MHDWFTFIFAVLFAIVIAVLALIAFAGFKRLDRMYYDEQTISKREHSFSTLVIGVLLIAAFAFSGGIIGLVSGI